MTATARVPQAEVQRIVRALKAVGETVTGVDIRPDGSVRVLTAGGQPEPPLSDLERWELENGHRVS